MGSPRRHELSDAAESFALALMAQFPLARAKIMESIISADCAKDFAGEAAAARQEAFAISRVAKRPRKSNAQDAPRL